MGSVCKGGGGCVSGERKEGERVGKEERRGCIGREIGESGVCISG